MILILSKLIFNINLVSKIINYLKEDDLKLWEKNAELFFSKVPYLKIKRITEFLHLPINNHRNIYF